VAAGGGDEGEVSVAGDRREMLVAHDFTDADDCELDGGHLSVPELSVSWKSMIILRSYQIAAAGQAPARRSNW
jgi:hypothetical protein